MKNLKNIIYISLLVFLFIEVLVIFPNKLDHKVEVPSKELLAENSSQPEQKMRGLHLVETQQGRRDWELFSEVAEGYLGKGAWELKNVRVLFYNNEKLSFTVTGDLGSIDGKTKDLKIKGNVVTRSENGYTFKTQSIFYISKLRQIKSPERATMQGPADEMGEGFVLDGSNMEVFVDDNKMVINKNVHGSKKFKDNKNFYIQSDKAEFSGKSRQAKFIENVDMTYAQLQLQGPIAIFQYKGNSALINYVQMEGGVKVRDRDKLATAENVNLNLLKNIFIFRGKPKLIQNSDELTGEEIVFLDGGKRVRVDKVQAKMEKKE